MQYLTQGELYRLMAIAKKQNRVHWQAMLTGFYFGLRVSEVVNILGEDVQDDQLDVKRLKNSQHTLQPIPVTDPDSDFHLELVKLAKAAGPRERIFQFSRQRVDQFMKRYCRLAGIHRSKAHFHAFKHSIAMIIWDRTKQPGQIKAYLGHRSMSSAMQYLNMADSLEAQRVVASLKF
jgi:integrase